MTVEGTDQKAKVEETTQVEEKNPTESEEKSTVPITETPEFRTALDKALGKGLESTNRQLSAAQAEANQAKATVELNKSLMEDYEKRMTELEEAKFADDPEALNGFRDSKKLELRNKKADLRDAEQDTRQAELDALRWAITMHDKATELQKQYEVPMSALELCTSEEQMVKIAEAFPKVGEKKPSKEVEDDHFDSGGTGGTRGVEWRKLSPQGQIAYGLKQKK